MGRETQTFYASGRYALLQMRSPLALSWASLDANFLLPSLICGYEHQRKQIFQSSPYYGYHWHSPCLLGGLCTSPIITFQANFYELPELPHLFPTAPNADLLTKSEGVFLLWGYGHLLQGKNESNCNHNCGEEWFASVNHLEALDGRSSGPILYHSSLPINTLWGVLRKYFNYKK